MVTSGLFFVIVPPMTVETFPFSRFVLVSGEVIEDAAIDNEKDGET